MVSNKQNVTDKQILDVALAACRSVMAETRQSAIAMDALEADRPIPLGTMPESLMVRTVELATQAIEMAVSRPERRGRDTEIMQEALAACRCVIARQREIDEVLEALETDSPIPPGSMETVQLQQHATRALRLEQQP